MDTDPTEPPASELNGPFITQQKSEQPTRPFFPQAKVAALVFLTALFVGFTERYLATLRPELHRMINDFETDKEALSWFENIRIGTRSVGSLLSGIMMELWGRRRAVQIAVYSLHIGWVLIAVSTVYPILLVEVAVCSFGIGASIPAIFFHLQEMADPKLRGTLSACILLTYDIGLTLPFLIYFYTSWKILAGLGACIPLIALVGYSFLHESPVWYIRNNRISDARKVFSWLWGSEHHVQAERDVEELLKRVEDEKRAVANEMGSSGTYWGKWKQFLKPHVYKPFIIMQVFNLMYIVYWTNLSVSYNNILLSLNEGMLGFGNIYVLIMLNLEFIFNFCVILLWFGRRIICVSSGVGSGIAALLIGTLIYIQITDTWVFTGLTFLYVASTTCAYFVMAQTMIGEILPSNIRCVGGAFIFTMNYIVMLLANKYFLSFLTNVGTHCVLWIFGVSSLLCSLFLYLMLPETKGRSLVQIEEYFLQPNVLWLTRKKSQNIKNPNI